MPSGEQAEPAVALDFPQNGRGRRDGPCRRARERGNRPTLISSDRAIRIFYFVGEPQSFRQTFQIAINAEIINPQQEKFLLYARLRALWDRERME